MARKPGRIWFVVHESRPRRGPRVVWLTIAYLRGLIMHGLFAFTVVVLMRGWDGWAHLWGIGLVLAYVLVAEGGAHRRGYGQALDRAGDAMREQARSTARRFGPSAEEMLVHASDAALREADGQRQDDLTVRVEAFMAPRLKRRAVYIPDDLSALKENKRRR